MTFTYQLYHANSQVCEHDYQTSDQLLTREIIAVY